MIIEMPLWILWLMIVAGSFVGNLISQVILDDIEK